MTTAYPINDIENMKRSIDILSKNHHIEILKIIQQFQDVKINENKSGIYINLTFLPSEVLDHIQDYLTHINSQEQMLETAEKEKTFYKRQIEIVPVNSDIINDNDSEKEDKDNTLNRYSYIC